MLEAQYAMSNSHCHLQLGARGAVSPPVGPGQGPGGVPGGEAKILCLLKGEKLCLTNISSGNG